MARKASKYLVNGGMSCMAGFVLKNTLSDNGGVTRVICTIDEENNLDTAGAAVRSLVVRRMKNLQLM